MFSIWKKYSWILTIVANILPLHNFVCITKKNLIMALALAYSAVYILHQLFMYTWISFMVTTNIIHLMLTFLECESSIFVFAWECYITSIYLMLRVFIYNLKTFAIIIKDLKTWCGVRINSKCISSVLTLMR